jgi:hypothetical protein
MKSNSQALWKDAHYLIVKILESMSAEQFDYDLRAEYSRA